MSFSNRGWSSSGSHRASACPALASTPFHRVVPGCVLVSLLPMLGGDGPSPSTFTFIGWLRSSYLCVLGVGRGGGRRYGFSDLLSLILFLSSL